MNSVQPSDQGLRVHLFGPLQAWVDGNPLPRLRSRRGAWLLALLTLQYGRAVEREWLCGMLWPDSDPVQAYANLRRTLTDLRAALGTQAERLHAPTPHTLCLDLSGTAGADVIEWDAAVASRDPARIEAALPLYRRPLLEDCLEDWAVTEREQRAQAYRDALEMLADAATRSGCASEALRFLRLLTAADPLNEQAHRRLMQTLHDIGEYAAMTQCYRDLRLQREVNSDADPQTTALYRRLREERRAPASVPGRHSPHVGSSLPAPPHNEATPPQQASNLPAPLTPFVGREWERAEIAEWLRAARLVTLTGVGGIGKTRLAIQVAEEAAAEYPDGARFVDLSPITDPDRIPRAVADALRVAEQPGSSLLETLTACLRSRFLLLILDNCEHLSEACASLAARLLLACPDLRMLATSREALNVQGERLWRVPPLGLPGPEESDLSTKESVSHLHEHDAVRLFVERARMQRPDFAFTRENASDVAEICRRLDGIPLAIELAAARVRALSPAQIARRLGDRFALLTQGNRGAPARHQTLRAALDWSYHLLTPDEQALLQVLSVFVGGCTLEAAESLCEGEEQRLLPPFACCLSPEQIADLLAQLCDKPLVVFRAEATGAGRYYLLETVRQYAAGLAEEARTRWRERHRDWYLALAADSETHLTGPDQNRWLDTLEAEHDNLRAALAFCLEHSAGADCARIAARFVAALWRFWEIRGYLQEGRRWCDAVMRHMNAGVPDATRICVFRGAATLAYRQGDLAQAR